MKANGSTGHDFRDSVIDAAIAGSASVVGLMAGTAFASVRADPASFVYAGIVAFGVAFLASLRAARNRGGGDGEAPA